MGVTTMNLRDFREELQEAFLKGVEFAMSTPPTQAEIRGATVVGDDGALNLLNRAASKYASTRVLHNHDKLEPMP